MIEKRLEKEEVVNRANMLAASTPSPTAEDTSSNPAVYNEVKVIFQLIDINGDEKLSRVELKRLLYVLGFDDEFKNISTTHKLLHRAAEEDVDFQSFFSVLNACAKPTDQSKVSVLRAFNYFDSAGKGEIHSESLHGILRSYEGKWNDEDTQIMMRNAGLSKSKPINYSVFISTLYSVWECDCASQLLYL
jgi:Ca2+-binding EF-hand superfamily protein